MQDSGYLRRTFADARLLISCGDMPPSYLDLIGSVLNIPLFFVRGNHDERYEPHQPGGDNLHHCIQHYGGFSFAGLEGSQRYNRGPVQYSDGEMRLFVLSMLPRLTLRRLLRGYGVDMFIAHAPPRGIHDLPDDHAHRGFQAFLLLMRWARPRYLIHGHVDTWDSRKPTETVFGSTTVININPVRLLTLEKPQAAAQS
jgi:Icc-related predicted phosphoesterase